MTSGETALQSASVTAAPVASRPLFVGEYHHQVDAKGRVAVPAQLRRWLDDGSVVAPAPHRRLMLWTPEQWQAEQHKYRRIAETPDQEVRFLRLIARKTFPLEIDAQGRMLLSSWQREWTGIGDTAVFMGITTGVELCAEATWQAEIGDLDDDELLRLRDVAWVPVSAEARTS